MLPLAPGLFSMTNGCPNAAASFSPSARAARSVEPPGGNATTMRTGLLGYCAPASAEAPASSSANSNALGSFLFGFDVGRLRDLLPLRDPGEKSSHSAYFLTLASSISMPRPGPAGTSAVWRSMRNGVFR